ncbi:hypothetical protein ACTXT7_017289 [Hymenolepis weldensis]
MKGFRWSNIAAAVACFIAAILSLAAMFYYYDSGKNWSPFIATMAMSLNVALAGMLIFEIISSKKFIGEVMFTMRHFNRLSQLVMLPAFTLVEKSR